MRRRMKQWPPGVRLLVVPLAVLLIAAKLPSHPPVPVERPHHADEQPQEPAPETDVPVPAEPPAAAERPHASEDGVDEAAEPEETGESDEADASEPESVPGIHEDAAALAACTAALDRLGVVYSRKSTINDAGRCGIEAPVSVQKILPDVSLKPANRMRCETALALARWTSRVVKPAAEELGAGVRLTGLSHGSAYVCKHRDSIKSRKISEHAFGNAVDVVTFRFAGHAPLSIAPRRRTGKIEESFQRAVIGGACLYFTTVLGPRADSFHHDNLHLDIVKRSHGFRLCQ